MAPQTFIKHTVLILGIIGTVGLAPSHAATVDFSTWTPASESDFGTSSNLSIPGLGSVTLSTENSVNNAFGGLEASLGLNPNDYPLNDPPGSPLPEDTAYQGSALTMTFNAGDTLRFDWSFDLFATSSYTDKDYAFILFNGVREILASSNSNGIFNRTFNTAGTFSIGVVDIGDYSGNSVLTLSNTDLATPIPTPALIPGLIGLGFGAFRRRKIMDEIK